MSRLPPKLQKAVAASMDRRAKLEELLNSVDWTVNGYKDRYQWMSELYGPGHNSDLMMKLQGQFEQEGLL